MRLDSKKRMASAHLTVFPSQPFADGRCARYAEGKRRNCLPEPRDSCGIGFTYAPAAAALTRVSVPGVCTIRIKYTR
jgi:hypothetical protein